MKPPTGAYCFGAVLILSALRAFGTDALTVLVALVIASVALAVIHFGQGK